MSFLPDKEVDANFSQIAPVVRPPPIRKLFAAPSTNVEHDTFRVFLRIKPYSELKQSNDCISIEDSNKLVCKPPLSSKYKKLEKVEYTFSHIFGPKSSQTEIFSKCVANCVTEVLNNKNSLVFTYGTTNAGKTFTVQGSTKNPGIIPQTLNALFKNAEVHSRLLYKPHMSKDVIRISVETSQKEIRMKDDILRHFRASCKSTQPDSSHYLQSTRADDLELHGDKPRCGIWVSFLEVYNETINDLLNPGSSARRVAADPDDNFYVKELKQIYVSNAEEAFTIYQYGKKNLNMASTKLNENSSRSHSIFTIHVVNVNDERNPSVSKLCICDLAGTERQTKTQNTGLRLKEAGNINGSLFQLNRCLQAIRENQTRSVKRLIPFRHSNLTKLLQSALDDRTDEKIIMIVNINPAAELFDETQQVLKMCAIASKIKNKPLAHTFRRSTRFTALIYGQENISGNQDQTPLENICESDRESMEHSDDTDEVQELRDELARRENEIKHLQKCVQVERDLRESTVKRYEDYCKKVETSMKDRITSLEERRASQKEYYLWKIEEVKKNTILEHIDETIRSELDEKNARIEELESRLSVLKSKGDWKSLAPADLNNSAIKEEISKRDTRIDELQIKITDLEQELQSSTLSLSEKLAAKDTQIKDLESLVQEAKEEYLFLEKKFDAESAKKSEMEGELYEKNEIIEQLECRLEERERKIESLQEMQNEHIIDHEQVLRHLEQDRDTQLAERDNQIAKLKRELEEFDRFKNEMGVEVAALRREIEESIVKQSELQKEMDNQLAESKMKIETLTKEISGKDQQLLELKSAIKELTNEKNQLMKRECAEIATLKAKIEQQQKQLRVKEERVPTKPRLTIQLSSSEDSDYELRVCGSSRKAHKNRTRQLPSDDEEGWTSEAIVSLKKLQLSDMPVQKNILIPDANENVIPKRYNTRRAAHKTPSGKENQSLREETPKDKKLRKSRATKRTPLAETILDDSSDANVFRNIHEKGKTPDHRKLASQSVKKMFTQSPGTESTSPNRKLTSKVSKKMFPCSPSAELGFPQFCNTTEKLRSTQVSPVGDFESWASTSRMKEMTTPLQTVRHMKKK